MNNLWDWLKERTTSGDKIVYLVSHATDGVDRPVLERNLERTKNCDPQMIVYVDFLKSVQTHCPGLPSYSYVAICNRFRLSPKFDALSYVRNLRTIAGMICQEKRLTIQQFLFESAENIPCN